MVGGGGVEDDAMDVDGGLEEPDTVVQISRVAEDAEGNPVEWPVSQGRQ